MENKILRYFDLYSKFHASGPQARGMNDTNKRIPILFQYGFLILGILIQPYFASYQTTGVWQWNGLAGRVIFSVFAGLAIFPSVYKNSFDANQPTFVQLCAIFVSGLGWQSLMQSALKLTESASH